MTSVNVEELQDDKHGYVWSNFERTSSKEDVNENAIRLAAYRTDKINCKKCLDTKRRKSCGFFYK